MPAKLQICGLPCCPCARGEDPYKPRRLVDVEPATIATPQRFIYSDGTMVEVIHKPRWAQTTSGEDQ